jgi:TRAP-type mannitol/chloroaromatic compound transport system permease small subunit
MNLMISFIKVMQKIQISIARPMKWGLLAFMSLIVLEVLLRYGLNSPTIWGLDFRQQMYAVLIMLGSAYTLMVKGHVIVDTFLIMMPFKMRMVTTILGWIFFYFPPMIVLTYTMFNLTANSWKLLEGSGTIWNPPVYPLKTILTIAYANMVIQGVAEIFKDIISLMKGGEEWKKAL